MEKKRLERRHTPPVDGGAMFLPLWSLFIRFVRVVGVVLPDDAPSHDVPELVLSDPLYHFLLEIVKSDARGGDAKSAVGDNVARTTDEPNAKKAFAPSIFLLSPIICSQLCSTNPPASIPFHLAGRTDGSFLGVDSRASVSSSILRSPEKSNGYLSPSSITRMPGFLHPPILMVSWIRSDWPL